MKNINVSILQKLLNDVKHYEGGKKERFNEEYMRHQKNTDENYESYS